MRLLNERAVGFSASYERDIVIGTYIGYSTPSLANGDEVKVGGVVFRLAKTPKPGRTRKRSRCAALWGAMHDGDNGYAR